MARIKKKSKLTEKQQRKVVYFIGAGASYGAGAYASVQHGGHVPIPTQQEFWKTFFRFCKSKKNRIGIQSFLYRYFLGYKRLPSRRGLSARLDQLKDINVEEVFTFLSERTQAPSTSPQLRAHCAKIWSALVEEIPNVFRKFRANADTQKIYQQFAKYIVRRRDTIVSFNYDTILEDSLPITFRRHYACIGQKIKGVRILKPHGSINWETDDPVRILKSPRQPVIVAPTHLKFVGGDNKKSSVQPGYMYSAPVIKETWERMEREMKEAKALVFIGYSFPPADLYFSSVLRSVLADRSGSPGIVIVNPDAVAVRAELRRRFALRNIAMYLDIQQFVRGSREEMFELIDLAKKAVN